MMEHKNEFIWFSIMSWKKGMLQTDDPELLNIKNTDKIREYIFKRMSEPRFASNRNYWIALGRHILAWFKKHHDMEVDDTSPEINQHQQEMEHQFQVLKEKLENAPK